MDLSKMNESELVERAVAGDETAWTRILDGHRHRLRRMVALRMDRRLRGRVDPSDVIQDAFLEASARLASFADKREMPIFLWLRWLAGMRLNALHRIHLGFQARDATREVSIDRAPFPAASSAALADQLLGRLTSACEVVLRAERKARLQDVLDSLDPIDREILVLRHFEELSNAEAAQSLGLHEPAASKRYVRALRRLKEGLRASPGGSGEFRP